MLDTDARDTGFDIASHVSPALVLLQHATSCQYLHNRIQLSISMTKVGEPQGQRYCWERHGANLVPCIISKLQKHM